MNISSLRSLMFISFPIKTRSFASISLNFKLFSRSCFIFGLFSYLLWPPGPARPPGLRPARAQRLVPRLRALRLTLRGLASGGASQAGQALWAAPTFLFNFLECNEGACSPLQSPACWLEGELFALPLTKTEPNLKVRARAALSPLGSFPRIFAAKLLLICS